MSVKSPGWNSSDWLGWRDLLPASRDWMLVGDRAFAVHTPSLENSFNSTETYEEVPRYTSYFDPISKRLYQQRLHGDDAITTGFPVGQDYIFHPDPGRFLMSRISNWVVTPFVAIFAEILSAGAFGFYLMAVPVTLLAAPVIGLGTCGKVCKQALRFGSALFAIPVRASLSVVVGAIGFFDATTSYKLEALSTRFFFNFEKDFGCHSNTYWIMSDQLSDEQIERIKEVHKSIETTKKELNEISQGLSYSNLTSTSNLSRREIRGLQRLAQNNACK